MSDTEIDSDGKGCTQFKVCTKCNKRLRLSMYYKSSGNRDGVHGSCKQCMLKKAAGRYKNSQWFQTIEGKLRAFENGAVSHTTKRQQTRPDMENSELEGDTKVLWRTQNGLCHYTGIPLSTHSDCDWCVSIERIDPMIGYLKKTTVLTCQELNTVKQWTESKFEYWCTIRLKWINGTESDSFVQSLIDTAEEFISKILSKKRKSRDKPGSRDVVLVDGEERMWCKTGDHYVLFADVSDGHAVCKSCTCKRVSSWCQTPKGFVTCLINQSKNTSSTMMADDRDMTAVYTRAMFSNRLREQKGRCYLSQMPLIFLPKSDWKCSLYRIDENIGYADDNVRLVCAEFMVSANKGRDPLTGKKRPQTCRQTPEKVDELFGYVVVRFGGENPLGM